MKSKTLIICIFSLFVFFSCTSDNEKKAVVSSSNQQNIHTQEDVLKIKIDSELSKMIKKYDLPLKHNLEIDTDCSLIQQIYPLYKKIYYPKFDLTIQYHPYIGDCHESLELIICYRKDVICCIPIYGKVFYESYLKHKSTDYIGIFENELNDSYEKISQTFILNSDSIEMQLENFSHLFPKLLIEGVNIYRFNLLETLVQLESVRKKTIDNHMFNTSQINLALKNIDKIADNINEFYYAYYSIWDLMIIELKTNKQKQNKNKYELKTINYEMFQEFIF
ncbi:MAG: hypothetical protein PHI36_04055 [Bacteroidales bacterium]|nr:hypothetical protein [Bacteroidales bacterium]